MSDILNFEAGPYVCHCLRISAEEIQTAADIADVPTIRCVMRLTGAGTGCTACHRRIQNLLDQSRAAAAEPVRVRR